MNLYENRGINLDMNDWMDYANENGIQPYVYDRIWQFWKFFEIGSLKTHQGCSFKKALQCCSSGEIMVEHGEI